MSSVMRLQTSGVNAALNKLGSLIEPPVGDPVAIDQAAVVYMNVTAALLAQLALTTPGDRVAYLNMLASNKIVRGLDSIYLTLMTEPGAQSNEGYWANAVEAFQTIPTSPFGAICWDFNQPPTMNPTTAYMLTPSLVDSLKSGGANSSNLAFGGLFPGGLSTIAPIEVGMNPVSPGTATATYRPDVILGDLKTLSPTLPNPISYVNPANWSGTTWVKAMALVAALITVGLFVAVPPAAVLASPITCALANVGLGLTTAATAVVFVNGVLQDATPPVTCVCPVEPPQGDITWTMTDPTADQINISIQPSDGTIEDGGGGGGSRSYRLPWDQASSTNP